MNDYKYLHFTLGPVQGFVAQARRTRDLWAGSFLLSYLVGHAMRVVKEGQGIIKFPAVDKNEDTPEDLLLHTIIQQQGKGRISDNPPLVGTLPNRFKAKIPATFKPEKCVQAVHEAWENIAQVVWNRYLEPVAGLGHNVEAIWHRQIKGFWDMAWVVGDDQKENNLIDRRKNWRSYIPTVEPGDKCTITGNLQELSGYIRAKGSKARKKQESFWQAVREQTGFNLRKDERLCAVALVKRLFPLVAKETIGWHVPTSYPSTTYLSAASWIAEQISNPEKQNLTTQYAQLVQEKLPQHARRQDHNAIHSITKLIHKNPDQQAFASMDGNLLHAHSLDNDLLWPENTVEQRKQLQKALKKLGEPPGSYYAMVLMDGDSMGKLLQISDSNRVSEALARFVQKVPALVKQNNGVLIYAGGDDVLALTPLEDAINVATDLRIAYRDSFSNVPTLSKDQTTISAAIIYAHHHAPLKPLYQESHRLLDEIAKEKTGRDSLAICVWNTAGPNLEWSNPWERVLDDKDNIINKLVHDFTGISSEDCHYNSAFFYNIRRRWPILSDPRQEQQGQMIPITEAAQMLAAEYMKNPDRVKIKLDEAVRRMEQLLQICHCYRRVEQTNASGQIKINLIPENKLNIHGALLVRFLANKGVE